MTIKAILTDMDGVLTDFTGAVCEVFNYTGTFKTHQCNEELGLSIRQFWSEIDAQGTNFWEYMPPTPWMKAYWEAINSYGVDVFISTSPSLSEHCIVGKLRWLKRRLNVNVTQCVFGKAKYLMSNPEHILIDDYTSNLEKFHKYNGGHVVCLPQPWNHFGEQTSVDTVLHVMKGLDTIFHATR